MDDFCHACFCSGHIASGCPNSVKKTKTKDFKVKSNNIKNEFSTLIASSFKENSNCDLESKNFEKEIFVLKQKLEESEENFKNERIDFDKSFYKMQKSLMTSDVTIEELENEVVTIKSERDTFSDKLTCVQNNLSMSENSNFELKKKVVILNEEISILKQKLDDSNNKPNVDVVNANNDSMNFTSYATTLNDCDIFANDSNFEFTDDDERTYDYKGNSELSFEEKFRDLLKDYLLKRKEISNISYRYNDLEKEIKFLKKNLGDSDKKLELQKFDFEEKLEISQSKLLSSEKNLNLQRADFLEKLKDSQCKFLSCEKARKDLEKKMSDLSSEVEKYKSISHQFTNGSQGLDKLLSIGKNAKDRSGLGFDKASNVPSTSQTTFVKSTSKVDSSNSQGKASPKGKKFQNFRPSVHESNKGKSSSSQTTSKKFIPICHHCGIIGHIRPKCFKLKNDQSYVKLGASNRFIVPNEKLVSKNSSFQKPSPNVFEKEKAKFYTNRTYHRPQRQRFIPTCHHCGVIGHIRPKCPKILNEKSRFEINLFNKFDEIVSKISKLRNGMDRRPIVDAIDLKRNCGKNVWVKKDVLKNVYSPKVFDFSKIKILKRPGDGSN